MTGGRPADRRPAWQAAVFSHPTASLRTKVVLLAMHAGGMKPNGFVSIPRSVLAERCATAPARVSEAIREAVELGLLSRISEGRKGHTAEYQAVRPRRHGYGIRTHGENP